MGTRSGGARSGSESVPQGVRAAALQFDVRSGDFEANWRAVAAGLARARDAGIQLVVLPELWPTSFPAVGERGAALEERLAASEAALELLSQESRALGLVVAGSALARRPGQKPRNRFHLYDCGALVASYDKVHLFSPTAEQASTSAGAEPPPLADTRAGRIAAAVCYDLRFPELAGRAGRGGAQILVVPAQWPGTRAGHWRALVVGRAVEQQCWVLACNRLGREGPGGNRRTGRKGSKGSTGRRGLTLEFPGNSLIVDPHGRVAAEGHGEPGLVSARIDLELPGELRARVPVLADRRPQLYATWDEPTSGL